MAEGLVLAAHHPERHHHPTVLRQHARQDGMDRPLAGPDRIAARRVDRKAGPAVVEQPTRFLAEQAAAEWAEQPVDEAGRLAVAIDPGQLTGIPRARKWGRIPSGPP